MDPKSQRKLANDHLVHAHATARAGIETQFGPEIARAYDQMLKRAIGDCSNEEACKIAIQMQSLLEAVHFISTKKRDEEIAKISEMIASLSPADAAKFRAAMDAVTK